MLSEETGGFAVVNQNDFAAAFERLVDDNSAYYLLGYYSTNDRRDGRFRKIEVRVRQPGLTVRARKGYVAPRGRAGRREGRPARPPPELRAALEQPAADVGPAAGAGGGGVQGRRPEGRGRDLDARSARRDLPLTEKDGTFNNELEVVRHGHRRRGQGVSRRPRHARR